MRHPPVRNARHIAGRSGRLAREAAYPTGPAANVRRLITHQRLPQRQQPATLPQAHSWQPRGAFASRCSGSRLGLLQDRTAHMPPSCSG